MIRQFNTEVQLKRPGREFPVLFCFFLSEIFAGFLKNFLNAPLHTVVCRRLCYNRNDQGIQGGIKMAVSSIKVYFQSDLEWVWDVVTSLEDTDDLSNIRQMDMPRLLRLLGRSYTGGGNSIWKMTICVAIGLVFLPEKGRGRKWNLQKMLQQRSFLRSPL